MRHVIAWLVHAAGDWVHLKSEQREVGCLPVEKVTSVRCRASKGVLDDAVVAFHGIVYVFPTSGLWLTGSVVGFGDFIIHKRSRYFAAHRSALHVQEERQTLDQSEILGEVRHKVL